MARVFQLVGSSTEAILCEFVIVACAGASLLE